MMLTQEIVYAKITGKIQDATDGTEDGMIEYAFKKGGSNNISARFRGDALQLLNGTNLYIGSTGLIQFEGPNSRCIRNKSYSSRTQQQTELLHYPMQQARWCYKIVQITDQIKH